MMTIEWKNKNKASIQLYNEFYRKHSHLSHEERELMWTKIKEQHNIQDNVRGQASRHRKPHIEMNGVQGKHCSVSGCGWKPLTAFNYSSKSWDQLRTTCKSCLSDKRRPHKETNGGISQQDVYYRLQQNVRGRILLSIKDKNFIKNQSIVHHLGCTMGQFLEHIESTFTEGMSWDKYGLYIDDDGRKQIGFHIDHIIPCSAFDLHDPLQILLCFHWKNCRAMWGRENMSKGAKYNMADKIRYIESQREIITREKAEELVKRVFEQIETERQMVEKTIRENRLKIQKQERLYQDYLHDQCLEGIQIMFFMYENGIHTKDYKATPFALMKNKESRKSGAENPRSKTVYKLSMDGEILGTYESMNQAAHDNRTFHAVISKCCHSPGALLSAGGFRWCFEHHVISLQQRCRFVAVMEQLLKRVPRYEPKISPPPRAVETRKMIGETMKEYFATEEGRRNKREAHKKRSETMSARRENVRSSITEKQCRVCEKILPVTMFCKKSAAVDGLQPYCKPCVNEKKKSYKSRA